MAVLTADVAVKDDFLRGLGESADFAVVGSIAADEKERKAMERIYWVAGDLLSRELITEEQYNEVMAKCRKQDSQSVSDFLDDLIMDAVNEIVHEVREEMRAEKEQTESK